MTTGHILSICLKSFPGADRALVNLSRATGATRHVRVADPRPASLEMQFLVEHLGEQPPSMVLLGAWSPAYRPLTMALGELGVRIAVYWTSSGGQTALSSEIDKLNEVLASEVIHHLVFSGRGLAEAFRGRTAKTADYLPLLLGLNDEPVGALAVATGRAACRDPGTAELSLFCPAPEYARKNVLNTLLALSSLRVPYHLHVNGLSSDPGYGALLERLEIPYRDHGWMAREIYEQTIGQVDLGLQLSYAETFNYVAAEHLLQGVPVVLSPMVPVAELLSPQVRDALVVDAADDPVAIRDRLERLLADRARLAGVGAQGRADVIAGDRSRTAAARVLLRRLGEPSKRAS